MAARGQFAGDISDNTPAAKPPESAPIKFQVLQSRKINLGNRSLIINRVVPPILPDPPPPIPPATAEQIAAAEAAAALQPPAKKYETRFLFVTVYDRKVTEITWYADDRECRIFSNIDFNFLPAIGDIETADTIYSWSSETKRRSRSKNSTDTAWSREGQSEFGKRSRCRRASAKHARNTSWPRTRHTRRRARRI